jgi:DNA-binding HxlR family transcriptional regulator
MICRTRKTSHYVSISNSLLECDKLSWDAKGLLCYLLSKPDWWEIRFKDLKNKSTCGRDALKSIIRELEKSGYIRKSPNRDERGRVRGWVYEVFEEPITVLLETRDTENPPLSNTQFKAKLKPEVVNPSDMTESVKSPKLSTSSQHFRTPEAEPPLISALSPTRQEFEEFVESEGLIQIQTHKDYDNISWRRLRNWKSSLRALEKVMTVQ